MRPQTVPKKENVLDIVFNPLVVTALSLIMRVSFFLWGLYQDAHMVPRFTDIDYYVFTDAASYVAGGSSPYERATYRYTPLLAWILVPTAYGKLWFSFGKFLFMLGDILAGWLMIGILQQKGASKREASMYASIWLLNPMVCVISARGSSEGFLGAVVIAMIWLVNNNCMLWGGIVAGFAIHLKIYPMIYVPTIYWAAGSSRLNLASLLGYKRLKFIAGTIFSFLAFTGWMYYVYGQEYIDESALLQSSISRPATSAGTRGLCAPAAAVSGSVSPRLRQEKATGVDVFADIHVCDIQQGVHLSILCVVYCASPVLHAHFEPGWQGEVHIRSALGSDSSLLA